jgi:hypothetical protein
MGLEDAVETPAKRRNPYHFKARDFIPLYGMYSYMNRAEKVSKNLDWNRIEPGMESAPLVNGLLLFCYNAAAGGVLAVGIQQLCHYLK